MTHFNDLGLAKPLLKALAEENYATPTPIQAQAIPTVLTGRDLLGIAQTGTGKTAAFALPILHRLAADRRPAPRRGCRVLVLSPTRELATQIAESFRAYGRHMGFTVAVVFGGVKYGPQVRALAAGVDILVATPGRLIDHINEKIAVLSGVETFVLDEADQMLDLGFLPPIRRIVATLPRQRQNLFFSAPMPGEIGKLAAELLVDPARVAVAPAATTVARVDQQVLFIEAERKRQLLAELFAAAKMGRALIFTRTKRGADRVAKYLDGAGIRADSIHGDKSQGQRERALAAFKAGQVRALVATDSAARGSDVDAVTHVVNFELPNVPEAYVHRIGRTARAGAAGVAISLCANDERSLLRDIQKLTRQTIPAFDRRNDRALGALAAVEKTTMPERAPIKA
ncbi:MAG: DEAD/DEAH box helicase, partial [Caulobacteraceae bacterium]